MESYGHPPPVPTLSHSAVPCTANFPGGVSEAVIKKELDPIKGMMQKKLELKGQMTTIVKYVNASKELVECATRVQTAFLDEK